MLVGRGEAAATEVRKWPNSDKGALPEMTALWGKAAIHCGWGGPRWSRGFRIH